MSCLLGYHIAGSEINLKIDRMIGILSLLLQRERITAPELAAHFEVSRRTISRDIDDLCRAGIPICTTQGIGGGIQIMEGYRMDRTLLTSRDMQMIMAGLRSLDSVSGSHYTSQLMEKIKAGSSDFVQGNDMILIDLSSWNKEAVSGKIELIQAAIELKQAIRFDYYSPKGESTRMVDPYYLIFKRSSWYVWGFCRTKQDFRMFKLNRMDHLVHSGELSAQRAVPMPEFEATRFFPAQVRVKALFDPSMKWHLIESYQWYHDGQIVMPHGVTAGTRNESASAALRLAAVTMEDAGEYTAEAINGVGTVRSETVRLTVLPADAK